MWMLLALAVYAAAYAACFVIVRVTRRRPLGLDAALAAAMFVCAETLVVHALSGLRAVGRPGLLVGNALLLAVGVTVAWSRRSDLRWPAVRLPRAVHLATIALAMLGGMVLVSALAYPPNNWDSMTYRLARVAHWLQLGAVGAYDTNVARQVVLPPGAEYLVLVLQGISGSDRLASLVQFGAWILLAAAAPPLARIFGAPRRLAPYAAILVAASPLAVQEASSTQNDLVAGILAVAMVISALPFVHRRATWRTSDLALTVLAVAAGLVTKPTSAVVAAPFLIWGGVVAIGTLHSRHAWRRVAGALPALVIAAAVVGPFERARASVPPDPSLLAPFVYRHSETLRERAVNAVRGVVRNVPLPIAALDRLSPEETVGCPTRRSLCLESNLAFREDYTASIGQAIVVVLAMVAGLLRARRLPRRTGAALVSLMGAWLLFHALFRDNVWTPRLHVAYFALAPVALGAFRGWTERIPGRVTVLIVAGTLVAFAGVAAAKTARRPLNATALATARDEANYYRDGPGGTVDQHEAVLRWLVSSGCQRLGLYIGEDSYDYPLTWRAMQRGVEVRHVVRPTEWPCAVFSDRGTPPRMGAAWASSELPFVFVPPLRAERGAAPASSSNAR
jgi:hypothetical protein